MNQNNKTKNKTPFLGSRILIWICENHSPYLWSTLTGKALKREMAGIGERVSEGWDHTVPLTERGRLYVSVYLYTMQRTSKSTVDITDLYFILLSLV